MIQDRPGRIDVSRAVAEGWRAMLDSFPFWLVLGVSALVLMAIAAVTVIGLFVLVPVLGWGALAAGIAAFDGRRELRLLFSGFHDYGHSLCSMWGVFLLSIAISLPGAAAAIAGEYSGDARLAALGDLLELAWNLAMLPLSFAVYFAVDQRTGALEAFRRSWRCTKGQWLPIFLLALAGVAIALLGLLALVVGIIPASALIAFMWISAYRQLTSPTPAEPGATAPLPAVSERPRM
jgi:uncharacterized membrane protein